MSEDANAYQNVAAGTATTTVKAEPGRRESMSDAPANGKTALGVQAYRWLVAAGLAVLTLLSQRTLAGIDETAKAVNDLKAEMRRDQGTTESRFNAHAQRLDSIDRRNDTQDSTINAIQLKVWSMPGGRP